MSATADVDALLSYWRRTGDDGRSGSGGGGGSGGSSSAVLPSLSVDIAVMRIPGRTFPVTAVFLEDVVEAAGITCEQLQPPRERRWAETYGEEAGYIPSNVNASNIVVSSSANEEEGDNDEDVASAEMASAERLLLGDYADTAGWRWIYSSHSTVIQFLLIQSLTLTHLLSLALTQLIRGEH